MGSQKNSSLSQQELSYSNPVDAALARKPTKQARLLSLLVTCFFIIMIGWAAVAEIDQVTHAEGKVISSRRTQTIQNLEGGILQSIMVQEGEIVKKGTLLAQIDNATAESSYRDAVHKSLEHQVAIIRLEAELAGKKPVFSKELQRKAPQIIKDQQAAFRIHRLQKKSELSILESQHQQKQREVQEQTARKRNLDRSLSIAIQQRNIAYPLVQRKTFSRVEFLGLEQKVATLRGDVEALAASIPKTQAAAREAAQRVELRQAEMSAALREEINTRRVELSSLYQIIAAGSDRVTRTELRSPVYGTIQQIYLHTVGGVVKPGESIMDIVPRDDTLLIEAKIRPADVAFLHPGQKAMVKFSAYDFAIYGGLTATLEHISADTIEDKHGDIFYLVRLRTQKNAITYKGKTLPIIPGMVVVVDILTGRKTILDYILKPILKAKQNALTER